MFFLRFILILIGLSFLVINSSAQKKLASVTTISTTYDENYKKVDTSTEYYDKNGKIKYNSITCYSTCIKIETKKISSKEIQNKLFYRFGNDTIISFRNEYSNNKCRTIFTINNNDTIRISSKYKRPVSITLAKHNTLKKNSIFFKRFLFIENTDTNINDYNRFFKISKSYRFNTENNEWYISDKSFYRNVFCIDKLVEIRYNRFTKKYIKTIRKRRKKMKKHIQQIHDI